MSTLGDMWHGLTGKPDNGVPSHTVIPRMRESSGLLPAIRSKSSATAVRDPTPLSHPVLPEAPPLAIAPPAWSDVFPVHFQALVADLQRRGEDIAHWEVQDGRDMGVSEDGHAVAFRLHKTGTSATIQVELTMCRGKLASVRVR